MSLKLFVPALLLLASVLVLPGCSQTCDQLCAETEYYIDGCLEAWDALWSDFGYDGRFLEGTGENVTEVIHERGPGGEYVDACLSRYSEAIGRSVPEDQTVIRGKCAENLQSLAEAVGCHDYRPAGVSLDPTAN
jgi:hypothetical protein